MNDRKLLLAASCLLLVASADAQVPLDQVFEPGFILEDRNGDGVVDFVNAELSMGEAPEPSIVAAGADISMRLGFETMAMNLPLSTSRAGVGIAVGADAAALIGVTLEGLAPDEGLVTTTQADGRDWVVVAGPFVSGTRAAALAFSGRMPHLWEPDGTTFAEVLDTMSEALEQEAIQSPSLSISRLVVREDAVSELVVDVDVAPGQVPLARQALVALAPSYEHVEAVVLRFDETEIRLPRVASEVVPGPIPARPGAGPKRELDLSNLFTPDGLLGDGDTNLIADRVDAVLAPAGGLVRTVDVAARLGLESTGISVPIVRLAADIDDATKEPTLVILGEHSLLSGDELPPANLERGEGIVRVVPGAFGPKPAVVVQGFEEESLDRAIEQLAERLPHIWERGKDRTTLDDVELDLWKFFSGRSPAGQAAAALYKLEQLVTTLQEKDLRVATVVVSVEKPQPGLERAVQERTNGLADAVDIVIDDRDVQNAATIFDDRFKIESEVAVFRRLFKERVVEEARGKTGVRIEARLSEPAEVRAALAAEVRDQLGADAEVQILSAYKQGYSWLYDAIRPKLEALGATDLTIHFARYQAPEEWSQQAMGTPLRWLHEAFPIDEVLARETGLGLENIRFEAAPPEAPPYEVVATTADGTEVLRESFSPKLVLRPYIDRFRDYEMVGVTTGWLSATADGETILDQRIVTDAEQFWDHFQERSLPDMYDYVMDRHDGNPRGVKDAPYFGELRVELSLSEPHEILGIDKEIISPMDALHEDIYFTTLLFYRLLGRNARGDELTYPGRVIPVMEPLSDGGNGQARIHFTGFATSRPAVVIRYEEADGTTGEARLDLPKIEMGRPKALAARVRAGEDGITRLEVRVKADTDDDERDLLSQRAHSQQVDERILSAAQVEAMVTLLSELRDNGAYRDALAYHDLGEITVRAGVEHKIDWENERVAVLPSNGEPLAVPDIHRFPVHAGDGEIVQWDTPIPPPEAYGILARMESFDEASVYKMGESYLGQDIWAMDLMPPLEASHFSQYKATTLKPTVIYSARQHANEVSSTSHVLKLAELLLTEPEHRAKLDKVNVVVHPITNADGAQLAFDLYEDTPDFILHAGYLASLGMDVTSDGNQPMPIYPESTIRRELWNMWLPDIFLNPHGYPSHQLVQLFSEFTGLVRRGRITERNWSMNKGWFIPGFSYTDDPRYPRHKEAAFQIRDYITKAINGSDDVYSMNQRNYDRYRRYGEHFDEEEVFKLPMVDEVLIHTAIKGSSAPSPGSSRGYNPKVTIWSGSTEAPDETAYGDWMKLVATAGLSWDLAILQYLVDGEHEVERKGSSFFGGVSLSLDRPRPPKNPEEEEAEEDPR